MVIFEDNITLLFPPESIIKAFWNLLSLLLYQNFPDYEYTMTWCIQTKNSYSSRNNLICKDQITMLLKTVRDQLSEEFTHAKFQLLSLSASQIQRRSRIQRRVIRNSKFNLIISNTKQQQNTVRVMYLGFNAQSSTINDEWFFGKFIVSVLPFTRQLSKRPFCHK